MISGRQIYTLYLEALEKEEAEETFRWKDLEEVMKELEPTVSWHCFNESKEFFASVLRKLRTRAERKA